MKQTLNVALALLFGTTVAFANSGGLQPKIVDAVLAPYLSIQKGLAGDDLKAAQSGAGDLLSVLKNTPNNAASKKQMAALSAPAQTISESSDIKTARTAFHELSNAVIPLVQDVDTTGEHDLFVAHCPMAFGHQGGDWLQSGKKIANPYYGSKMLRCGSIQKQITGHAAEMSDHSMHEHQH